MMLPGNTVILLQIALEMAEHTAIPYSNVSSRPESAGKGVYCDSPEISNLTAVLKAGYESY